MEKLERLIWRLCMIDFNIPPSVGTELKYIEKAILNKKICGDGEFTGKCSDWISRKFGVPFNYLTTSCTHALEMAALLCDIRPGDEVILPSYTFCSTADALVQRGARLVFTDIRPDTLNIDELLIENAVTDKTKAIMVVHYAGVGCEMDTVMKIAKKHNLKVIEDAAQGFGSYYKGIPLGTIGNFGCYSFHETKNFSMGEGGALVFTDEKYRDSAEICREKGTDRSKFFRGQIDKYTWRDYGSSYLPSDINAAYLWAQLERYDDIFNDRMNSWDHYDRELEELEIRGNIETPYIPPQCDHNAHMYYIKTDSLKTRTRLLEKMREREIQCVFHYVPLHSSPAGIKYGEFRGEDNYTTKESERIVRLPLYYGLSEEKRTCVIDTIKEFYR